jgi:ribosomal protein S21
MAIKTSRAVNVECVLKPNESTDKLIKRFIKKCKKEEIIKEYLEKISFFRSPSEKRKHKRAKNRHLRHKEQRKSEKFNKNQQ